MQKVAQIWEKVGKDFRTWKGSWSEEGEEKEEDSRTSKGAHHQKGKKGSGRSVFWRGLSKKSKGRDVTTLNLSSGCN